MNIQECDILNNIICFPYINQRRLSETSGHSLGVVNRSIKNLLQEGYINDEIQPTQKALDIMHASAPKNYSGRRIWYADGSNQYRSSQRTLRSTWRAINWTSYQTTPWSEYSQYLCCCRFYERTIRILDWWI